MTLDATLHNRDGDWVLTLKRDFAHPPEVVWPWLTDPERLARWSPIVPDRPFDAPGARRVRENPDDDPVDGEVLAVDPPRELLHRWGDDQVRWRLQPTASGCRLTLEQRMSQRNPAPMNAAGWDVCLTVLARALAGDDVQRSVGPDAMAAGWEALRDHYAEVLNG
jgi:uncharacterized protein YndB with AHSA1/START domain